MFLSPFQSFNERPLCLMHLSVHLYPVSACPRDCHFDDIIIYTLVILEIGPVTQGDSKAIAEGLSVCFTLPFSLTHSAIPLPHSAG